jgi:tetratricopeptide (TPR) repeat protein
MALMRTVGDTFGVLGLHRIIGWLALRESDYAGAGAAFSAELVAAQTIGDRASIAWVLSSLGDVARMKGAFAEAAVHYEESLALYRELDFDQEWMARVLRRLGEVALELGDLTLAQARVTKSLATACEQGEAGEPQIAPALEVLGGLAAVQGRAKRALRLAGAAAVLRERLSEPPWPYERAALARWLTPAYQALDEQAQGAAWTEGRAMPLEKAITLAMTQTGTAEET